VKDFAAKNLSAETSTNATQAMGFLTFPPVGLPPTEHASLSLDALRSKYSRGAAVVLDQVAEALATADCALPSRRTRSGNRKEQEIVFALMVSFLVIMLHEIGHDTP
jgi:hypothetical protein